MNYKGYIISPASSGAKCYSIATEGRGGKIPDIMGGVFTSRGVAMQLIDSYVESKQKNVKTNDEKISKS